MEIGGRAIFFSSLIIYLKWTKLDLNHAIFKGKICNPEYLSGLGFCQIVCLNIFHAEGEIRYKHIVTEYGENSYEKR